MVEPKTPSGTTPSNQPFSRGLSEALCLSTVSVSDQMWAASITGSPEALTMVAPSIGVAKYVQQIIFTLV
jgi:hypothetical protein